MKSLRTYITDLLSRGKYFFSKEEALLSLQLSSSQFQLQAYRLSQKKILKRLTKGFFMIIPAEYYNLGSVPPHWIIDPLMKYLGQDYYIGLLSAAALYGATQQQPMTFQVITNKQTKNINLERGGIEFHVFKRCPLSETTNLITATGYAKISTKEQTLVDLVRFYQVCGFLDNVALVIKELAVECSVINFALVVKREKTKSVLQRLGYILEVSGLQDFAKVVAGELSKRKIEYIILKPEAPKEEGKKIARWKLILNDSLEVV